MSDGEGFPISTEAASGAHSTICEVVLVATSPTGLESLSVAECHERLKCQATECGRGKIMIKLCEDEVIKVQRLRSVDNIFVLVKELKGVVTNNMPMEDAFQFLEDLGWQLDFELAVRVWKNYSMYLGNVPLTPPYPGKPADFKPKPKKTHKENVAAKTTGEALSGSHEELSSAVCTGLVRELSSSVCASSAGEPCNSPPCAEHKGGLVSDSSYERVTDGVQAVPRYRVTCNRTGDSHKFTSMEAARAFGGSINDRLGWKVDLSNSDIEVLLNVKDKDVQVVIALTSHSMHRRNISHFGPTTLRSTICNGMLRMAKIQPGEVVCDPMCGGGSISIEGALAWSEAFHLCGDCHELACPRAAANVHHLCQVRQTNSPPLGTLAMDVMRWDVCNLPLRSASVDVLVTDAPFGKRSGSRSNNRVLYPLFLKEMARVCRPSGRAVILSQDKRTMARALANHPYWHKAWTRWVNVGGLTAGVYLLNRKNTMHPTCQ